MYLNWDLSQFLRRCKTKYTKTIKTQYFSVVKWFRTNLTGDSQAGFCGNVWTVCILFIAIDEHVNAIKVGYFYNISVTR